MATVLMVSHGTAGDVLPFVRVGQALRDRGHDVTLLSHAPYGDDARRAGLHFVPVDDRAGYERQLADTPALLAADPTAMREFYRRHKLFDQIRDEVGVLVAAHRPGRTVLLGRHTSALSVLLAGELTGAPVGWVAMSPTQYLTAPVAVRNLRRGLSEDLAAVRSALGLPPVTDWAAWFHSAGTRVNLWPRWFDEAGTPAPAGSRCVGFVLPDDDPATPDGPLPDGVEDLLAGADRPVLVTGGTGRMLHERFYRSAAGAARATGRPVLAVTPHADLLDDVPGVHTAATLPFRTVVARVAAVVHHGGIGTCARALAAGVPQVVLADGADRPDNAARLARLGLAGWLPAPEWTAEAVTRLLERARPVPPPEPIDASAARTAAAEAIEAMLAPAPQVLAQRGPARRRRDTMRLLLSQNMLYLPSHGGANRSNRLMMEQLAERGHQCVAVAPMAAGSRSLSVTGFLSALEERGITPDRITDEVVTYSYRGVRVHAVTTAARLPGYAHQLASDLRPTWTLVPSDDPGSLMLAAALRATPDRVVYLAYTLQQLPLGPGAFYPTTSATRMLRRAAGVVSISRAAQDYLRRWGDLDSTLFHPPVYGPGPYPRLGRFGTGTVTMVNPCSYKGIAIFLALADAMPETPFLAVPTWGTTAEERAELTRRPNVTVLDPVDDIRSILARTGVLVMASLWDETFGYTAVEAMLHGVPVVASDVGGLGEAKLGVPYLLPVDPITRYHPQEAGESYPRPVVPPQDTGPWLSAVRRLLTDAPHYEEVAEAGRTAATRFVAGLDLGVLEDYLHRLSPAEVDGGAAAGLDPERRAALARLLARRA